MTDRASLSGTVIDKYELLEKVGEGGMAEVYRGRHLTLGREVAVKLLHPHLSSTERNRVRFEREARAIASLEHDHILRIFDYSGKDSPVCYIVTEFIEGSTLKEQLERTGKISSEVAAMIAIELCDALTFAHARGIIHRDIKPENVMIRRDGVVKLMDFGIARVLDDSTMTLTGGLVGSPAYMSPEQASDQDVDVRSDIFSLGTLLYRTVTDQLPFVGRSTPVILRNIIDGNYADPMDLEPGLDPLLADIIRKALHTDPAQRFASAPEMAAELGKVLEQNQLERGPAEIRRFLDDPAGYDLWLTGHLSRSLVERGRTLIAAGNSVSAMKLFNRVLVLDEHNDDVMTLIRQLHEQKRPWPRLLLGAFFVLCLPLAALLTLSLGFQTDRWPSPASSPASAEPAHPGSITQQEAAIPVLEPSPAPIATSPTPAVESLPSIAPALTENRVLPFNNPGMPEISGPRSHPGRERTPTRPAPGQQPRVKPPVTGVPVSLEGTPALMHIRTVPYAEIFINGRSYGNSMLRKDPISLPPGEYLLRLINPLCEIREERVKLTPGQIFEAYYPLIPLPARLHLRNFDPGTELFLDGERLGLFASLSQPVLIRKPRQGHLLRARLADGAVRDFPIAELDPKEEVTIDAVAPR